MADTLQTLALLNGQEIALTQAKGLVDQCGAAIGQLQAANAALKAPVVTSLQGVQGIGIKSQLTQRAEAERLVGIGALVDAIKANPSITPSAAQAAWVSAVAAIPAASPLENPVGVVTAIMAIAGKPVWSDFTAMVAAGDRAQLIAACLRKLG
jgi:hypothetical protein